MDAFAASGFYPSVAESRAMRETLELAGRVAASRAPLVLLVGPRGSGKGSLARSLHAAGGGSDASWRRVACPAATSTTIEGALVRRDEPRETVFLESVHALPEGIQRRLLVRLDGPAASRARIVAATERDLRRDAAAGAFLPGLAHRLGAVAIRVPTLVERAADVLPLARIFLSRFAVEFGRADAELGDAAIRALRRHDWPGQVRELRLAIERALLLADGPTVRARDLPFASGDADRTVGEPAPRASLPLPPEGIVHAAVERSFLEQAIERTGGNRSAAARLLGMHRDHVRYRLRKYGLAGGAGSPAARRDPPSPPG